MALNFPSNPKDQSIYVDPSSGLKYIYNLAIGGWETAIQPPVVITSDGNPPDIQIPGFLWWNAQDQILYIFRSGLWTPVSASGGGGGGASVTVDHTPPLNPVQGDLWWDTVSGRLFLYYVDLNSQQWVNASPAVGGGGGGGNVFIGPSAPPNPIEGDLWFNDLNNQLYVYKQGSWIGTSAAVAGVNSVTGTLPVVITGTPSDPIISVENATTTKIGVSKLASQAEVDDATSPDTVLTPLRLHDGIDNYLPQATEVRKGVAELATEGDVLAGTDPLKMVTPATLNVALSASGNPPGTVITFAGITAPEGYLICNGDLIPQGIGTIQGITADFTNLYDVIGTSFSGNGIDHTLPDLRGEFVRGWSMGKSGVDSGRALGSFQSQSVQVHTHTGPAGPADVANNTTRLGGGNRVTENGSYETNAAGSDETRPRNIALMYCIKY